MMLITLEQAKRQLRVTHDDEDYEIEETVEEASAAIVRYLKPSGADAFLDTSGELIEEAIPVEVKRACKITVTDWWKNREGQKENAVPEQFGYGYALPQAAIALLYPMRDPTLI